MGYNYHGFLVEPKYVVDGKLSWHNTGNGEVIVATKGGVKYRLKKRSGLVRPVMKAGDTKTAPAMFKANKAKADYVENKQKKIKNLMKGLSFNSDKIIVEEEHFWDEDDNKFVTVMRYVDVILPGNFKYENMSMDDKLYLFKCMAIQLKKIHEHHIIHSDLKPENFMFAKEGGKVISYLLDFDGSYPDTEIPSIEDNTIGGPIYTDGWDSPEIQDLYYEEDDAFLKIITNKTDIFTLGLIFHKLFTGALPTTSIENANPARTIRSKGEVELNIKKLNKEIGPKCKSTYVSLINWMLAYDVENKSAASRPSADDVLKVLNDEINVPEEFFYKGSSDTIKFQQLHQIDKKYAELDLAKLEKLGVTKLKQVPISGKADECERQYIVEYKGEEYTYNILDLIEKGFVKGISIPSKTKPEDNIDIIDEKYLRFLKVVNVEHYFNTRISADLYKINYYFAKTKEVRKDILVKMGLAYTKGSVMPIPEGYGTDAAPAPKPASPTPTPTPTPTPKPKPVEKKLEITVCEPWPEDNISFNKDVMVAKGYVSIERAETGSYKVTRASGSSMIMKISDLLIYRLASKLSGTSTPTPKPTGTTPTPAPKPTTSTSSICEPWPEDEITFVSLATINEKGCTEIIRGPKAGRYFVKIRGMRRDVSANSLVNDYHFATKNASSKPVESPVTVTGLCELFDEDKPKFEINHEKFAEKKYTKMIQTTDGTKKYIIYDEAGNIRLSAVANNLAMAGYFKRK